jgi:hypothetical protein
MIGDGEAERERSAGTLARFIQLRGFAAILWVADRSVRAPLRGRAPAIKTSRIGKIGILVAVRRGAAAEEAQGLRGGDLMPGNGGDEDGIARADGALFAVDLHGPLPFEDEVELFAELMIMALGGLADGNHGFREALVLHGGVGLVQDAADGAAVLGGEGRLLGKLVDRHARLRYCS